MWSAYYFFPTCALLVSCPMVSVVCWGDPRDSLNPLSHRCGGAVRRLAQALLGVFRSVFYLEQNSDSLPLVSLLLVRFLYIVRFIFYVIPDLSESLRSLRLRTDGAPPPCVGTLSRMRSSSFSQPHFFAYFFPFFGPRLVTVGDRW